MKKFLTVFFCALLCCLSVLTGCADNTGERTNLPTKVSITGAPNQTVIFNDIENTFTLHAEADKTGCEFLWETSNSAVLTVDGGRVTLKGEGSAKITVKIKDYENVSDSVEISTKLLGVKINGGPADGRVSVSEDGFDLTAQIITNGSDSFPLIWSSSNENVVKIEQDGKVKIISVGATTIKATSAENGKVFGVKTIFVVDHTALNPLYETFNQATVNSDGTIDSKFKIELSADSAAEIKKANGNKQLVINKAGNETNSSISIVIDGLQTGGKYKLSFDIKTISGQHTLTVQRKLVEYQDFGSIADDKFNGEFVATKPQLEFIIVSTNESEFSLSLDEIKLLLVEQGDYADDIL